MSGAHPPPEACSLLGFDFSLNGELSAAPNPKPSTFDKARFGRLASLYTSFSSDFAAYALDLCIRQNCRTIADPFAGMGTLAEVGRTRPIHLILGDISPFATLASCFRSSPAPEIDQSTDLLERISETIAANDERMFFETLFKSLESHAGCSVQDMVRTPSDPQCRTSSLAIFLAALSRIVLYKQLGGSNPTWIKRPRSRATLPDTLSSIRHIATESRLYSRRLPALDSQNRTDCRWASVDSLPIGNESLDAIVTSPPYANRTDYIHHYLPASELLLNALGCDEREIRLKQIGTPLIRQIERHDLPDLVSSILTKVRVHPSYASERYYYKCYLGYFSDMRMALSRLHSWLRPGGLLILVVQDSYYKEISIPTADMMVELAKYAGLNPIDRREWRVAQHLSRLSPHALRAVPNRALRETALIFNK